MYIVENGIVCIDLLRAHRHFREAELDFLRFQQCIARPMTLMHDITGSYLRHANLRHATPTSPAPMFPFLFLAISYSITNCLYTLIRRKNLRQHSNRSSTLASSPSYINWVRSPVGLRNERHRIRISWLFRCSGVIRRGLRRGKRSWREDSSRS